jgi:ZIP family zinc transporter
MHQAIQAALWGLLGGSALMVGAVAGLTGRIPQRIIALVMAFGAGVLLSAVSFELMDEAYKHGGLASAAIGLLSGALVFFAGDLALAWRGGHCRKSSGGEQPADAGAAIALGALLDGIPESIAIGASLVDGGKIGVAMVVAVFLSNVPEALSSATGMAKSGRSRSQILSLWTAVALASGLAAGLGNLWLATAGPAYVATIQAFAAGAVLAMLASTMMPEAYEEGGAVVGLLTALGFLAAFTLDKI